MLLTWIDVWAFVLQYLHRHCCNIRYLFSVHLFLGDCFELPFGLGFANCLMKGSKLVPPV